MSDTFVLSYRNIRNSKRIFALSAVFLLLRINIFALELDGFEFINKEISEILYSISMARGIPIVADDTVSGTASFRFAGSSFESAFDSFLNAERLYVRKTDSKWIVSRINFVKENDMYFLDACDVKPSLLVEKLSSMSGEEITYDSLPENIISIHTKGQNVKELVSSIIRQFGEEYSLKDESNLHIKKENIYFRNESDSGRIKITKNIIRGENNNQELFTLDVSNGLVNRILERLFAETGCQYIYSEKKEHRIKRAYIKEKTFDEMISLISAEGNLKFINEKGLYYFFESEGNRNNFLESTKNWKKYYFSCLKYNDIIPLLRNEFTETEFTVLPEENAVLCFAEGNVHAEICDYLKMIDSSEQIYPVTLKYIKTSDLITHLPRTIDSSHITAASEDNLFFFEGSEFEYNQLKKILEYTDVPVHQIRYDILVIQYQNVNDSEWNSSLSAKNIKAGDRNSISATLGSVLDFNLDVIAAFGLRFASSLQSAINENKAHVFADTSLHGINGKTVNFSNTNIYRYRDNNLDPETGKPVYSGITREISSGLKLEITGWATGEEMVTCNVNASVSRQGTDVSSTTGNPPPTSEKIITTEVRCRSGEPVVLSALIQNEDSSVIERTPFISKIPLIGSLFKSKKQSEEQTKMVIYLVPVLDEKGSFEKQIESVEDDGIFFRRLLEKFVFEGDTNGKK